MKKVLKYIGIGIIAFGIGASLKNGSFFPNEDAKKRTLIEENDKNLEEILIQDAADQTASLQNNATILCRFNYKYTEMSSDEVKKYFTKLVADCFFTDMKEISEIRTSRKAADQRYGCEEQIIHFINDFSFYDMKLFLAKKEVYEQHVSNIIANVALKNEIIEYVKNHESLWQRIHWENICSAALIYFANKV